MSDDRRKYKTLSDWESVRAFGLDPGIRPVSEHYGRSTPTVPQPPVPAHYPVSFALHDVRTRAQNRGRLVDRLLEQAGVVKPRRR